VSGFGVALVIESALYTAIHPMRGSRYDFLVALPLTLSFFAMIGLRRVFRIPVDLAANWPFRITEDPRLRRCKLDAVLVVFVLLGGLPALVLCAPLEFTVIGPKAAWVLLIECAMMLAFAQSLLLGWRTIPFTFGHNPERRHVVQSISVHAFEFAIYAVFGSNFIAEGLENPVELWGFAVFVLALLWWLRRRRRLEWGQSALEFGEVVRADLQLLELLPL
jgi:MYXO-CTERM domain-containing protein